LTIIGNDSGLQRRIDQPGIHNRFCDAAHLAAEPWNEAARGLKEFGEPARTALIIAQPPAELRARTCGAAKERWA
jgi:hypothetical protein